MVCGYKKKRKLVLCVPLTSNEIRSHRENTQNNECEVVNTFAVRSKPVMDSSVVYTTELIEAVVSADTSPFYNFLTNSILITA